MNLRNGINIGFVDFKPAYPGAVALEKCLNRDPFSTASAKNEVS